MHMKIAIIGAGAMGCLFACLLDNYEVTLYDVSPVAVERISRDGILLQEPDGTESRHRSTFYSISMIHPSGEQAPHGA